MVKSESGSETKQLSAEYHEFYGQGNVLIYQQENEPSEYFLRIKHFEWSPPNSFENLLNV